MRSHSWFQNSSKRGKSELTFEGRVLTQQQLCPLGLQRFAFSHITFLCFDM